MYTRIDLNYVIKVADFGLAESIGTKEYFRQDKSSIVKLPLRWLAPESLEEYIFSEKSDVVRWNIPSIMVLWCVGRYPCFYLTVGLWCNLLGDLHGRESPLCQYHSE